MCSSSQGSYVERDGTKYISPKLSYTRDLKENDDIQYNKFVRQIT